MTHLCSDRVTHRRRRAFVRKPKVEKAISSPPKAGCWVRIREQNRVISRECRSPVRFSCSPCAASARRSALTRSPMELNEVAAESMRPGSRKWWHTVGRWSGHAAAPAASTSCNPSPTCPVEQEGGTRRCLSRRQATASRGSECRGPHQRRVGERPQGVALESLRVAVTLSAVRPRWPAGRIPVRTTAGVNPATAQPTGRHFGQWPRSLRFGQRGVDFAHDCLGRRGGVRRSVPPRPCAQATTRFGLFRAAAPARAGPGRCRGADRWHRRIDPNLKREPTRDSGR